MQLSVLKPLHFLLFASIAGHAQTVIPLWSGPAPLSHGATPKDTPSLTVFLPQVPAGPTSVVVICPVAPMPDSP